MITWTDRMILLAVREHSERGVIVRGLTAAHGVQAGLTRISDRTRHELQAGNRAHAVWRARLADQLGNLSLEVDDVPAAGILDDPLALAGLQSLTALAATTLPEREPCPALFEGASLVLDHLPDAEIWPWLLVRWEVALLGQLGYALDLSRCALSGAAPDPAQPTNDPLAYVSPKSGRAVTLSAGTPWADKLLPLPGFLLGRPPQDPQELIDGMALTAHFLANRALAALDRPLPAVRLELRPRLAAYLGIAAACAPLPAEDPDDPNP